MKFFLVKPALNGIRGQITLPGDKSIAHRSIILSAISQGKTRLDNIPANKDCQATIQAFKKLGVRIIKNTVLGKGLYALRQPAVPVFVSDSGTTLRLILGVLAGQNFKVALKGGKSLSKRPMLRVTAPLRMMGAKICARRAKLDEYLPVTIRGGKLRSITYKMPVPSAQVKSAILLAGLYAHGKTCVVEPIKTRDHTERLLKLFKADIKHKGNKVVIKGGQQLVAPGKIYIPGDISSASFFLVLAAILPNSHILIKKVSLNPSRLGIVRILKRMGASLTIHNLQLTTIEYEPIGDITVRTSRLKGTVVKREEIPALIDELPILMVAASFAHGKTLFQGVGELRIKETDRIKSMSDNLKKMGVQIEVIPSRGSEDVVVRGVRRLVGAKVSSYGDHRTAMSMVVAGLAAECPTTIDDISCISKSFPEFLQVLKGLIRK